MNEDWQHKFAAMDRPTFEHFVAGGRKAGETAGREFLAWRDEGSGKDYKTFPNAVGAAIVSAREQMLQASASADQIEVWTFAFREAFEPYTEGYEQLFQN